MANGPQELSGEFTETFMVTGGEGNSLFKDDWLNNSKYGS